MNNMKKIVVFCLICILFCSCARERKKIDDNGLLTKEELVDVLVDIHLMDAKLSTYNSLNKSKVVLEPHCYDSIVFAGHDCNDSIFRASIEYYTLINELKGVYDAVIDSLNVLETLAEQKMRTEKAAQKTDTTKENNSKN